MNKKKLEEIWVEAVQDNNYFLRLEHKVDNLKERVETVAKKLKEHLNEEV